MLRTLSKSDLEQILRIEENVHISPWNRDTFLACFSAGYLGFVIEAEIKYKKKIVGFILSALQSEECHILNLCVDFPFQRKGLGRQLLEKSLKHAKKLGIPIAFLEVRASNAKALHLYYKMGFQQVGIRKAYYPSPNGDEDALVLAKNLTPFLK